VPGQGNSYKLDDYVWVMIEETGQDSPKFSIAKILRIEDGRVAIQWLWNQEDFEHQLQSEYKFDTEELIMTSQESSRQFVDKECLAGVVSVTENARNPNGYWWNSMIYFDKDKEPEIVSFGKKSETDSVYDTNSSVATKRKRKGSQRSMVANRKKSNIMPDNNRNSTRTSDILHASE
jgi:hypothetical protein